MVACGQPYGRNDEDLETKKPALWRASSLAAGACQWRSGRPVRYLGAMLTAGLKFCFAGLQAASALARSSVSNFSWALGDVANAKTRGAGGDVEADDLRIRGQGRKVLAPAPGRKMIPARGIGLVRVCGTGSFDVIACPAGEALDMCRQSRVRWRQRRGKGRLPRVVSTVISFGPGRFVFRGVASVIGPLRTAPPMD